MTDIGYGELTYLRVWECPICSRRVSMRSDWPGQPDTTCECEMNFGRVHEMVLKERPDLLCIKETLDGAT